MSDVPTPPARVFVYGTLLRGLPNHHILEHAEFVGRARTTQPMLLLDLGPYPAAVTHLVARPGTSLSGEVFDVDGPTLTMLDLLEDSPSLYARLRTEIALEDGSRTEAWVYVLAPAATPADIRWIPDGDCRAWVDAGLGRPQSDAE